MKRETCHVYMLAERSRFSGIHTIFVSIDVNVSVICPSTPTTLPVEDSFSYGPHLRYLRLDGNEIKPPIPMDLMTCFRLLQAVII